MMGSDYLYDAYGGQQASLDGSEAGDIRDSQYFRSIKSVAAELGVMGGVSIGLPHAQKMWNKSYRNQTERLRKEGAAYRRLKPELQAGKIDPASKIRPLLEKKISTNRITKEILRSNKKLLRKFGVLGIGVLAYDLSKMIFSSANRATIDAREISAQRRFRVYDGGEEFYDSRVAATQRQRAISAIHNSQMSFGRKAFGEEASWLHQ